jgi:hypothetical protein
MNTNEDRAQRGRNKRVGIFFLLQLNQRSFFYKTHLSASRDEITVEINSSRFNWIKLSKASRGLDKYNIFGNKLVLAIKPNEKLTNFLA